MWFFKVILLGAPGLGKTTARRRLTGEIENISSSIAGEQPSTGAVESGHSVVIRNLSSTTALITPSEWLVIKSLEEEARMLLQYFKCHISGHKSTQVTNGSNENVMPKVESTLESSSANEVSPSESTSIAASSSPPLENKTMKQSQFSSEFVAMIRTVLGPKHWKEFKQLYNDTAFVRMEDTGGQPEFMDMLPALTIGPALYLLFCKLTDALQSTYNVSYISPTTGESTTPVQSTYILLRKLFSLLCQVLFALSPHLALHLSAVLRLPALQLSS